METYKFAKTIYENKISSRQFQQIYEKGVFNKIAFDRIRSNPKFNIKFDNNKILLACVMVIQREHYLDIKGIYELVMSKNPPYEFVDKVLKQARAYGIYSYYRDLNNDKIPLPLEVIEEVKVYFNSKYSVANVCAYAGENDDAQKLVDFLQDNLSFTYIIYDIMETGTISSYIYQRLELKFKINKIQVKLEKLLFTEDE